MTKVFNDVKQKELRRKLRKNMTEAEKILWNRIRRRQLSNKRFLRQYSVNKYIIDFYCPEIRLAIEVDGELHNKLEEKEYDKFRQEEIETFDIGFLRFSNSDILRNIEYVISVIEAAIKTKE